MANFNYNGEMVHLARSSYQNNGSLYVGLFCENGEYYGDVTVNLPISSTLPSDCAFIDSNNMPDITTTLVSMGVVEPIYQAVRSGFCQYFAYRFNIGQIEKLA